MNNQQKAYYNTASFESRQQRPTKKSQASTADSYIPQQQSSMPPQSYNQSSIPLQQGYSQSNYQSSIPLQQPLYANYAQQSSNYGNYQSSVPLQQVYSQSSSGGKTTGYTETEINVLRGKGNEERPEFDLGKDGAFSDFRILVGCFYYEVKNCWDTNAGKALSQKGFKVTITDNEREFIQQLRSEPGYDVTWIISNSTTSLSEAEQADFKSSVLNFHRSGRGLFIYGDNSPWIVQANWVLPDLVGTKISGNTPGCRVLGYGKSNVAGEFDSEHLIFSGINYLYEGATICFPESDGKLTHLATSTDGHPVISFMDSTPEHGRVLVDNGFTKLYMSWDSAGQARYVVNGTVYLVDVERRFDPQNIKK